MTFDEEARSELTTTVRSRAVEVGFDLVGIAPAVTPTGFNDLVQWLQSGFAGEMGYIERRESA